LGANEDERSKVAKDRIAVADAGLKELELGERVGYYVQRDEIARHVKAGDGIVKSRLLAPAGSPKSWSSRPI
jgi:hypothetical protein